MSSQDFWEIRELIKEQVRKTSPTNPDNYPPILKEIERIQREIAKQVIIIQKGLPDFTGYYVEAGFDITQFYVLYNSYADLIGNAIENQDYYARIELFRAKAVDFPNEYENATRRYYKNKFSIYSIEYKIALDAVKNACRNYIQQYYTVTDKIYEENPWVRQAIFDCSDRDEEINIKGFLNAQSSLIVSNIDNLKNISQRVYDEYRRNNLVKNSEGQKVYSLRKSLKLKSTKIHPKK